MATGQDLLNLMQDQNSELQLQPGQSRVAAGLRALNNAQDAFETVVANCARVFGSTHGNVTTSISTEFTSYPTGLLRLDALWMLDPATQRPIWKLKPIMSTGDHGGMGYWLTNLVSAVTTGRPNAYWTNGTNIFWEPLPSQVDTVRWYGFMSAADITANGTFAYPDVCRFPIATIAGRIMKTALDDPPQDMITLAKDVFDPLITQLDTFNRDTAQGLIYERRHDT